MEYFSINIEPQYVKITPEKEVINGVEFHLHEVQKRMKIDFKKLPEITFITAPTGTGKSYSFPFPVLKAKNNDDDFSSDKVRGLIVLPTNALIDELDRNFKSSYPQLTINKITGVELNKFEVKGFKRWEKIIELADSSDLVITNPDIINYAMHGGYHKFGYKGAKTHFSSLIDKFNYIIFDEYHLYDEAQIANIVTLVRLRELFLKHYEPSEGAIEGIRFLFVSATPQEEIKKYFDECGYKTEEIIEKIVSDPVNSRIIHGEIKVKFQDCKNIQSLVSTKLQDIIKAIKNGSRVLIILDRLRDVQELGNTLKSDLENQITDIRIILSTGYEPKGLDYSSSLSKANLIIATNKAEVGVNYDVDFCIMQPGKYFNNFVQRFGRIARGSVTGNIIVAIDNKFGRLKRDFSNKPIYGYYEFMGLMKKRLQSSKFYSEIIPTYIGEYMWCILFQIRRNQDYNVWRYLKRRLNEDDFYKRKDAQRFFTFQSIHNKINDLIKLALHADSISQTYWNNEIQKLKKRSPHTYEWANWWQNYLETYLSFRDNSKTVKIIDSHFNFELEYSLDWILQNKKIERIETIQVKPYEIKKYYVGDFKEHDKDIQYIVSTIPSVGMMGNNLLNYNQTFELNKIFEKRVGLIYKKVKKGVDEFSRLQMEICQEVTKLSSTFNRKRLKIEDIEGNDNFL